MMVRTLQTTAQGDQGDELSNDDPLLTTGRLPVHAARAEREVEAEARVLVL